MDLNKWWIRSGNGGGGGDTGTSIASTADGGMVLGGYRDTSGGAEGWLLRTDNWGNLTCAEAGLCAGVPDSACDDKDPCTADGCDPLIGCTHKPHPENAPCGEAKVCKGGKCAAL